MAERKECTDCGNMFQSLGIHWSMSDCLPKLSEKQKNIIEGVFIGDGWLEKTEKNARISVSMINKEYLEYLDKQMQPFTNGVSLKTTAQESAKHNQKVNALGSSGDPEKHSDLYRLQTCVHPHFNRYRTWYKNGTKIIPKSIEINPLKLKHWFVSDGCFQINQNTPYSTLGVSSQKNNKETLEKIFEEADIEIGSYNETTRKNGTENMTIVFNKDATLDLFDYIGDCPPGFEYKFPASHGGEMVVQR